MLQPHEIDSLQWNLAHDKVQHTVLSESKVRIRASLTPLVACRPSLMTCFYWIDILYEIIKMGEVKIIHSLSARIHKDTEKYIIWNNNHMQS